jgi:hypothetical protein
MRSEPLFIFRGFADDSEGVLAAVHRLALVRLKLLLNGGQIWRSERGYCAKLHIAVLANAKLGRFTDDPKFSLFHTPSLRPRHYGSTPVQIKPLRAALQLLLERALPVTRRICDSLCSDRSQPPRLTSPQIARPNASPVASNQRRHNHR